jgi:hypothetical protein
MKRNAVKTRQNAINLEFHDIHLCFPDIYVLQWIKLCVSNISIYYKAVTSIEASASLKIPSIEVLNGKTPYLRK